MTSWNPIGWSSPSDNALAPPLAGTTRTEVSGDRYAEVRRLSAALVEAEQREQALKKEKA